MGEEDDGGGAGFQKRENRRNENFREGNINAKKWVIEYIERSVIKG